METGTKADVRLFVRVPKHIKSKLVKTARKTKVSTAEVVRVALVKHLGA